VEHSSSVPALEGLALESVEWLPSGADSGLVRVRGRWIDMSRHQRDLPALGLRRGGEARRFESLPDARFGRDPAVWRATYLVPAALMDPEPEELWLSWESGARAGLPAPARGFEPPATPVVPAVPEPQGDLIDRGVLAERRARRAEAAERAQAERAAAALKAVEVLELRSAELERRLEALQSGAAERASAEPAVPERSAAEPAPVEPAVPERSAAEPASAEGADSEPVELASAGASSAAPASSTDAARAVRDGSASAAAALTQAVSAVKRLRYELGEQRQRLRKSELLRAADAVALASFREEEGRARRLQAELKARERELATALEAAEARANEAAAAREQAAEQVALAAQRSSADAAAVRSRAAEALAAERAATAEARAELEAAGRDLKAERAAHAETREQVAGRERELAAIGDELARVRAELATVRQGAAQRARELERRLVELDAALEAERRAHGIAAAERETARAGLAIAESARSAESVARAALDDELDRERAARAALTAAVDASQAELAAALATQSDLVLSRERARAELATAREQIAAASERAAAADGARELAESAAAATRAELEQRASAEAAASERADSAEASAARLRAELDAAGGELAAAQARIADLERQLEAERGALETAGRDAGGLLERIAQLERADDDDLDRRAREQAAAAAAVAKPDEEDQRELIDSLDVAAAALRARPADEPVPATDLPAAGAAAPAAPSAAPVSAAPEVEAAPPPVSSAPEVEAPPAQPAAPAQPAPAPPATERPARPRIVTEAKHPARADIVGSSKREYPWLRGALVKLAHDDPRTATRLLLGLVPVQRALVRSPLEYDLTIRGSGTYAISIGEQGAAARSIGAPRPRDQAAFHASADVVTLAELLAGVEKRMGRWLGSVRVHGPRRRAEALRAALVRAELDLAAAARAGADLDPELVFRAFAYAIHPSWTKGHTFTVAQEITGPRPMRWHIAVRDGRPVSVERRAPAEPPDAVVAMTRAAFTHLLRGEHAPSGERPAIRGDRAAVALLKSWTDRAQGRPAPAAISPRELPSPTLSRS